MCNQDSFSGNLTNGVSWIHFIKFLLNLGEKVCEVEISKFYYKKYRVEKIVDLLETIEDLTSCVFMWSSLIEKGTATYTLA